MMIELRTIPFYKYAFRDCNFVTQMIVTPIVMKHRIEVRYSRGIYDCDCDVHTLKIEIMNSYFKDFLNLNFPKEFSDITLYRFKNGVEDTVSLDRIGKIDFDELMIKVTQTDVVNFDQERYVAAIDPFVINAIKRSFLVEAHHTESNTKCVLYNSDIINKFNYRRDIRSIIQLIKNANVLCAHELINNLYVKANMQCVRTLSRKNDMIIL